MIMFAGPLFMEPVFKERIWGGTRLHDLFGYGLPSPHTGECWAVSAHPNGQSIVKNGPYRGMTLGSLWTHQRALFCEPGAANDSSFPLLVKILDASEDLSVQVHPDDAYAARYKPGELGKTECWYVLDCHPGAEIIYGHRAASRAQLAELIRIGDWEGLLDRMIVKPGDFIYCPSGTLHALGKGIVVLEIQQSSDTTFRVYDYDRADAAGRKRELHLQQAIDVMTVPHQPSELHMTTIQQGNWKRTTYVTNSFFTVQKWSITGSAELQSENRYIVVSVIEGAGTLEFADTSYELRKGDHYLLPRNFTAHRMIGRLICMAAYR